MPPAKTLTRNGMGMLTSAEESAVSALMDMAIRESGTPTHAYVGFARLNCALLSDSMNKPPSARVYITVRI
jgi:hypothetical protein